jgi:nicotinate-nucleotide pyrophosphorylase (carboxylating)
MLEPYDYLPEDLGKGDVTTEALITDERARANLIAREDCILAGVEEAARIFEHQGLVLRHFCSDGDSIRPGTVVMEISGSAKGILKTERLALNFIIRMSGMATLTRQLVEKCKTINPDVKIAATRKTTPGFRKYEKKAVELGGGIRHREGLYDQILIKDNHLQFTESITDAVRKARESGLSKIIEIEVVDLSGAIEAAKAGAEIIMLDNMQPEEVREAARSIRDINSQIEIEISGGVTPENITSYAEFADRISLGWLTHSAKACDFSIEIIEVDL